MSALRCHVLLLVLVTVSPSWGAPPVHEVMPDPASVTRLGPAYRYPQSGWVVLHIEGDAYERGYQHGQLLAGEIADHVKSLAQGRSARSPGEGWRDMRLLVNALFLRRYEREFLEEMKGIADGASNAGAKFEGRPIDLLDIVSLNSGIEVDFLESNLEATPTGLEGQRFREPPYAKPKRRAQEHCSAFAAVGPATADGKIVFGHITMWSLFPTRHYNIWLDIKPKAGQRVLMQTFPGGIMSGLDYYQNDAGILLSETTIGQTRFDITGTSLVSRIRKAIQYGTSIDEVVRHLQTANNGCYSNEWLIADTEKNEIAMFELGTHKSRLWRSSRGEWPSGTEGFYWGCNNAKDLAVRLETLPSLNDRPANAVFFPSERDLVWLRLYNKHKGKIGPDFGFEAFTTAPLAAFPSCDAKFTTTQMAKELKSWALFGPPRGHTWLPTDAERLRLPEIRPLVSNDWTVLSGQAPEGKSREAVDLGFKVASFEPARGTDGDSLPPAWRGTILPQTDADIWLAAAFAEHEKLAALESSLEAKAKDGPLSEEDREQLAAARFAPAARYRQAVRRLGKDIPLARTKSSDTDREWYRLASAKGILLLSGLRKALGGEKYAEMMDAFGTAHSGQAVQASDFQRHAEQAAGRSLAELFDPFILGKGPLPLDEGGTWTIGSFEHEPEQTVIVYGTLGDRAAQKEAAAALQRKLARRWYNADIPIRADIEINEEEWANKHILLIGRPATNALTAKLAIKFPVRFGPTSFVLRGKTYAHPGTALILAGDHPNHPARSVVVYAGLGAESTWHCVRRLADDDRASGQGTDALLMAVGEAPRAVVAAGALKTMPAAAGGQGQ